MPHTAAGDIEIYWESHGRGKPLLLISGVSGGTWTWEESIGVWSPHFRVIVFDNMGAGRDSLCGGVINGWDDSSGAGSVSPGADFCSGARLHPLRWQ